MTQPPSPTILIVDDEDGVAQLIQDLLLDHGYAVYVVHNGLQALEWLAGRDADLVISDVMMPRMNGAQLAARLAEDKRRAAIPVILMSAIGIDADEAPANVRATFAKPFDIDRLLALVADVLGGR